MILDASPHYLVAHHSVLLGAHKLGEFTTLHHLRNSHPTLWTVVASANKLHQNKENKILRGFWRVNNIRSVPTEIISQIRKKIMIARRDDPGYLALHPAARKASRPSHFLQDLYQYC